MPLLKKEFTSMVHFILHTETCITNTNDYYNSHHFRWKRQECSTQMFVSKGKNEKYTLKQIIGASASMQIYIAQSRIYIYIKPK